MLTPLQTVSDTLGGPGPVFTNTPGWNKDFPYATAAPRQTAEASLRPRDLYDWQSHQSEIRTRYHAAESSAISDVSRQIAERNPTPVIACFHRLNGAALTFVKGCNSILLWPTVHIHNNSDERLGNQSYGI